MFQLPVPSGTPVLFVSPSITLPYKGNNPAIISIIEYILVRNVFCGLVVRVPGYITEMYSASCEVRTEFIYVM
jgi:hypothetical protein